MPIAFLTQERIRAASCSRANDSFSGVSTVTAMVAKGNIVATQFHPEKSQTLGLALIANFLKWSP